MGSFGQGFATGFFNKLSDGIDTRSEDARNYFNSQVETARALGLENKRRSSAMIDESVSIAKRLEAMGVPKDIIMAQANMDPASLGDFYSQADKFRLEAGVTTDDAFWRDIYDLSGTFQAPNEDFNTFFSRMYGPIVEAAREDPEGFEQDRKGSIWAKAFGYDAMERARDKLATTEVVPGMTAEQAIAQGDTPRPNKVGGESFVTVDPNALRKNVAEESINPQTMEIIDKKFAEISSEVATEITSAMGAEKLNTGEGRALLDRATKKAAYEKIKELYVGDEKYLSYIRKRYSLDEEGMPIDSEEAPTASPEATTAPLPVEPTTGSPEPSAPVEAPTEPVTDTTPLTSSEKIALSSYGSSYFEDNGDGTVTYTGPDGTKKTSSIASLRAFLNK